MNLDGQQRFQSDLQLCMSTCGRKIMSVWKGERNRSKDAREVEQARQVREVPVQERQIRIELQVHRRAAADLVKKTMIQQSKLTLEETRMTPLHLKQ
mmetsp:Transcript_12219/g.26932  ORF Transcript_12219/g.26932 Transcript_12219/m.26932 type:complete len:97 (-) Transcript_12219:1487-1777(-)